jgi:hypothetical protein
VSGRVQNKVVLVLNPSDSIIAFVKRHSITTPLTVLSKPHIIAASAYILAISMMKGQTVYDSLRALDGDSVSVWEDAFLPQDGIKPIKVREDQFQAEMRGESRSRVCL